MVRGILPPGGPMPRWGKAVAVVPAAVVQPQPAVEELPSKPAQRRRLSDVVHDAVELKLGESCGSIDRSISISLRAGPPPPDIDPAAEAAAASSSAGAGAPSLEKRQSSRLQRASSSMSVDSGETRKSGPDGRPPPRLKSGSDAMMVGTGDMVALGEESSLPPPPPPAAFAAATGSAEASRPAPVMAKRQSTKRLREEQPSVGAAEMMQVDQAPPAPPPRRSSSRMTGPGSTSSLGADISVEDEDSLEPPPLPLAAMARPSGLLARLPSKRMGRRGSSVAALLPGSSSCAVVPIVGSSTPAEPSCSTVPGPSLLAAGSSLTPGGGAAAATAAVAAASDPFAAFKAAGPFAATADWAAPPSPSSRFPAPPVDRRRAAAANPAMPRFPDPPQPTAMQLAAMRATAGSGGDCTFSVGSAAASGKAIWAARRGSTKGARKR